MNEAEEGRRRDGGSGRRTRDVHEPAHPVAVDQHAERVAPGRDLERLGDRAAVGELAPVAAERRVVVPRERDGESPETMLTHPRGRVRCHEPDAVLTLEL